METKKSPLHNLENHRPTFMLLGAIVAISVMWFAFEWQTEPAEVATFDLRTDVVEEEIVPITNTPPPPPPAVKTVPLFDLFKISDAIQLFDNELPDWEIDETTPIVLPDFEDYTPQVEPPAIPDETASFPGGEEAFREHLRKNIRYPSLAIDNSIQGVVYVKFIVNKDGSVCDIAIARGVDPLLDEEAMRVVRTVPRWNPGKIRGMPVRSIFTVPIRFQLAN